MWLKRVVNESIEINKINEGFEEIMERYNGLDKSEFSFEVRTLIPQEMEVGRPRNRGNLNVNFSPFFLFFATFLPWNYID